MITIKYGFLVTEESSIPLCLKTTFTRPIKSSGKPWLWQTWCDPTEQGEARINTTIYMQFYVFHRTQFHSSILLRKLRVCKAILSTANN